MDTFPDMGRIRGHNVIFIKENTGYFLIILISNFFYFFFFFFFFGGGGGISTPYFLELTKVI